MSVASYELGGPGHRPAIILVPGAGRTASDWDEVSRLLTVRFRVVAMELPVQLDRWSWQSALDDLAAVIERHGLQEPAVVGHSLGGIMAGLWAIDHPECPAAVNLDGHGPPRAEHLLGVPSATVEEWRTTIDALLESHAKQTAPDLLSAVRSLDLPSLWRGTRCPLLVLHAAAPPVIPGALLDELPWYGEMLAASARGLRLQLARVAEENRYVTVREIDAQHMVLLDDPTLTAEVIGDFLDEHLPANRFVSVQ